MWHRRRALDDARKPILKERARRWLAPALFVLGALALHARELAGGRPYWRDVHRIFVPVKHYIGERLAAGELPQWWPFDGLGMPLLSQSNFSVFHPVTLAYALMPFWTAFTFERVATTAAAGLGAYLVARQLKHSRSAAAIAGVLYGFNGYVVCLTEFSFAKLGAATLPWYVWSLLFAVRKRGAATLLPTVTMGLLLLAGEPQIALLSAATGLAFVVGWAGLRAKTVVLAVLSPVAGALLAAVQLVPSMAVFGSTQRTAIELDAGKWALELHHLAGLVLPINHGPLDFTASTFFGLAGVMLAVASVVAIRRERWIAAAWVVVLLSILLAAGAGFGLHEAAQAVVPFWKQFRYPIKSLLPAMFALSLLAAAGFEQLGGARRRPALAAGLVAGGVCLALASGHPQPLGVWPQVMLALTGAAAVLPTRPAVRALVPGALLVHLVLTCSALLRTTDAGFFEPSVSARALQEAGVSLSGPYFERLDDRVWPAEKQAFAVAAGAGAGATSYGALHGLPSPTMHLPGGSTRVQQFYVRYGEELRLAPMLGVGALVMQPPVPPHLADQVIATDAVWDYSVVKLKRFLPRAYAVHRARPGSDVSSALALFADPAFKPGREIIIESPHASADWSSRPDAFAVPAEIVDRTNTTVQMKVELPWDGFIVLNEAWFPGWTARVDGEPRPVWPANGLVRAVEVPKGSHRVEFVYLAPGLVEGAAISAATALALVLALLLFWKRHAHRRADAAR